MASNEIPAASFGLREAQPLPRFMDMTSQFDLDALLEGVPGGVTKITHAVARQTEHVHACLAKVFSGEDGRVVLEWLCDISLRRPLVVPGLGEHRAEYIDRREGQNALVMIILRELAQARKEAPPVREGV